MADRPSARGVRPERRQHLCAGGACARDPVQGQRRAQFRPGRDGHPRRLYRPRAVDQPAVAVPGRRRADGDHRLVAAPEFTLVIATFAIGLIIKAAIRLHWQDNTSPFDAPYAGPALAIGPLRVNPSYLVIIACLTALVGVLVTFFRGTKFGKAMRAVAIDPRAARLMGIRVESIFMSAWALAAGIGAVAGLLLAPLIGINPEIGQLIVKALVAAVIGGFTSLGGAVAGGLLLGVLETFCGAFFGATLKNIVPFGILIVLLLLKPQGLFGGSLQQRV
ncbi:MAG: branched-chain amino acid ABC transporter permease [Alphaproteobacteria bacterium]|nr:MAG: branched-chain amino acid ABC transporter permease [Alphaproteobacteria bacterium]